EQDALYRRSYGQTEIWDWAHSTVTWEQGYFGQNIGGNPVPPYMSPADASLPNRTWSYVSYLTNREALDGNLTLVTINDGLSSTMFFAEGYSNCWSNSGDLYNRDGNYAYDGNTGNWGENHGPDFGRDTNDTAAL